MWKTSVDSSELWSARSLQLFRAMRATACVSARRTCGLWVKFSEFCLQFCWSFLRWNLTLYVIVCCYVPFCRALCICRDVWYCSIIVAVILEKYQSIEIFPWYACSSCMTAGLVIVCNVQRWPNFKWLYIRRCFGCFFLSNQDWNVK